MKVGHVTERNDSSVAPPFLDGEEQEHSCSDPGNPGRLQLMARLSEGENFSLHLQKTNGSFPSLAHLCVYTCVTCEQVQAFRCLLQLSRLCR